MATTTVDVVCPVCRKRRRVKVSDVQYSRGLTKVVVGPGSDCPHTLLVFVEPDLSVRRVQNIDQAGLTGTPEPRGMSLRGVVKVFGGLFTDMLACVLQHRTLVLCDDIDVSITLYNTLSRLFVEPVRLGVDVLIVGGCHEAPADAYVVNCKYFIRVRGDVDRSAHRSLDKFLREAITVDDNDAAVLFVRQKISALMRAADIFQDKIRSRTLARDALTLVEQSDNIKIRYEDIRAVLMILRARGRSDVAKRIVMGRLDEF